MIVSSRRGGWFYSRDIYFNFMERADRPPSIVEKIMRRHITRAILYLAERTCHAGRARCIKGIDTEDQHTWYGHFTTVLSFLCMKYWQRGTARIYYESKSLLNVECGMHIIWYVINKDTMMRLFRASVCDSESQKPYIPSNINVFIRLRVDA